MQGQGDVVAHLVSFQSVLSRKGLPAATIADIGLLTGVCVSMPLEIVLAVEREGTHVAGEGPLGGGGVLGCSVHWVGVWELWRGVVRLLVVVGLGGMC